MSSTEHHPDPVTDIDRPVAGSIGEYDDRPPPPPAAAGWPRDDVDVERQPVDYDDVEPRADVTDVRDRDVDDRYVDTADTTYTTDTGDLRDERVQDVDADDDSAVIGDEVAGPPAAEEVDRTDDLTDRTDEPEPLSVPVDDDGEDVDVTLIDDPEHVRLRWQNVQVGFVDDPRGAIDDAGKLVDEVVDLVVTGVAAQRDRLGESWSADDLDTEQLRLALRRYREFLDRLLAV